MTGAAGGHLDAGPADDRRMLIDAFLAGVGHLATLIVRTTAGALV